MLQRKSQAEQKHAAQILSLFGEFSILVMKSANQAIEQGKEVDFHAIHRHISTFLKEALDNERSYSIHHDGVEILYAMTALADDIFLNMQWEGKSFWEDNILEQKFFHSQIAGDEVFAKIQMLLATDDGLNIHKAEVYLKMLAMGFQGKYRALEDCEQHINVYRKKLLELICKNSESMQITDTRLFSREYRYTIPTIHRAMLHDPSIVNYVCAFFLFMFFVMTSVIWVLETRDLNLLLEKIDVLALKE